MKARIGYEGMPQPQGPYESLLVKRNAPRWLSTLGKYSYVDQVKAASLVGRA